MKKVFHLTADSIDQISKEIESVCQDFQTERKTALRYRLSAEESLGIWREQLGEETVVVFETGKRMGKPFFQIRAIGEACNPYNTSSENFGSRGKNMLVEIGLIPVYAYADGANSLTFHVKKKPMNPLLFLGLIIVSALAVGLLGQAFLPESALTFLTNNFLTPLEDAAFRILSCIAGPMLFLSVAWGVYGIGDVYTLGRVGKKLMLHFFGVVFLFTLLGTLFYPLLGPAISDSSLQDSQAGAILSLLLDIIPSNFVDPFSEGNTLQIILLAFIAGLSLIFLGQRTSSLAKAIEQINHVISFLMEFISRLIPYFIFIILVQMIWSGSLSVFRDVWKFAVIFLLAYVVFLVASLLFISLRHRVSPLGMFRVCLPSYVIALTTASSAATFETNLTICKNKMGMEDSFASFGIPFGMVLFKPTSALYNLLLCFYFAKAFDVSVSVSWLAVCILVVAIVSVATPPIPGGPAAIFVVLFSQLGIPEEALSIAMALMMPSDFLVTSGNIHTLLLELFHLSRKLGMADKTAMAKVK